ncbi:hypothetical protein [Desulfobacula toluolica]|uniref:Conserved uncharacterized protein n=1 Tax=Desulfobacula toluolica (strain DSM 7467 / Tol2) TaxID=651182 RepID=K0NJD4_DESTT|nr:hypothetical protein [Desulfobacula toluolica]CCK81566.1 conserved uncharacterized protein [Desulfobacula toluolica Tol2]
MSSIEIHFQGDLVTNHKISLRVLSLTLTHIQSAINRSYLDITKKKGVFKHAKMTEKDFRNSVFIVGNAREGGYILDFLSELPLANQIIKRISDSLEPAFEKSKTAGFSNLDNIDLQVSIKKDQIIKNVVQPRSFDKEFLFPDPKIIRNYGDKSILKEIDQILAIIRAKKLGDNYFDLSLDSGQKKTFSFDRNQSNNFSSLIKKRSVGNPLIYKGTIRALDTVTKIGKFINSGTKKTCNLLFSSANDIISIREFLGDQKEIVFYGSPVIEYGSYDLNAGDIYFLMLSTE